METIPPDNAEMSEKGREMIQYFLSLPTIFKSILKQFSNEELIKFSLVNKEWNYEARCVLRDRGTLTARIRSGDHSKDFEAFASDLEKMRVVPFSGICVVLDDNPVQLAFNTFDDDDTLSESDFNTSSCHVILDRLQIKKLSLDFRITWVDCMDCPTFLLVEEILENCCGVLESLSFTFCWTELDMTEDDFPVWSYPRLKTLKLDADYTDRCFTRFVKALVSSAPNLKELQMVGEMDFDKNVLEGSSAVLVPSQRFSPLYEKFCESLIPALRPEAIEIYRRDSRVNFDEEIFKRIIPAVLEVSLATLKTFKMDLLFALPLVCYGICLENVTTLDICLGHNRYKQLDPQSLTLVERLDFTRIFPKVKQVKIEDQCRSFPLDTFGAFVEQGNSLLKTTTELRDRAIKIKQLTIHCTSDSAMSLLSQMFPDVKALSVKTGDVNPPPPFFTAIWDHFSNLEELTLTSSDGFQNKDSVFCGIFPEEVAELREKDDEYLKAVNIVPVMPAITCMKDLKTFTFRYTPHRFSAARDKSNFLFSKVTGFTAFARCPALAVTFQTQTLSCAQALSHMEPFASITSVDH